MFYCTSSKSNTRDNSVQFHYLQRYPQLLMFLREVLQVVNAKSILSIQWFHYFLHFGICVSMKICDSGNLNISIIFFIGSMAFLFLGWKLTKEKVFTLYFRPFTNIVQVKFDNGSWTFCKMLIIHSFWIIIPYTNDICIS